MANNVVFKTELLKGATGDRGEAGVAESVPTDGVILTTSETVPQGYEEIDVGDIFTELEAEIEERAKEDIVTDAYDATHTYNSGDYAIYNDTLYKCNTDNTTGAFNGNYWDAVTVMGEIADAQDDITTLNSTLTTKADATALDGLNTLNAVLLSTSGTYSDTALYTALKNNQNIIARKYCFFVAPFTGGDHFGFCYLYENTKLYGNVLSFHFSTNPRYFTIENGTPVLRQWATS